MDPSPRALLASVAIVGAVLLWLQASLGRTLADAVFKETMGLSDAPAVAGTILVAVSAAWLLAGLLTWALRLLAEWSDRGTEEPVEPPEGCGS
ncbi:MAG: hypothetical protein M3124_09855 [Actinomycetota bacterium]|nr:hypothetical protein [Actinomycetota bacterium]